MNRLASALLLSTASLFPWTPIWGADAYTPPKKDEARAAVKAVILAANKAGARPKVSMDLLGRSQRVTLVKADPTQITVRAQGLELPVPWTKLSDKGLAGLGLACAEKNAKDTKGEVAEGAEGRDDAGLRAH